MQERIWLPFDCLTHSLQLGAAVDGELAAINTAMRMSRSMNTSALRKAA
jgi:hypothetical protein